jgi:protein involved in polysaccharide export with SLBB domain
MKQYASIILALAMTSFFGVEAQESTITTGTTLESTKVVPFREGATPAPTGGANQHSEDMVSGKPDPDSLLERRATLQAEQQASRSRLESAKKRLEVQRALNNAEEVQRITNEVNDLQTKSSELGRALEGIERQLSAVHQSQGAGIIGGEELILPGENLELWVNEDPSLNAKLQVRRGGYILIANVGRVVVAGKTIAQAEEAVSRALRASLLRSATVTIERFSGPDIEFGPTIYLAGEFKVPRPFRIPNGTAPTLVSVILSSGGYTDRADLSRVRVMRIAQNRSVTQEVDVRSILEGTGLGSDIVLTEGDVVTIPSGALNLIYVTGRVARSGSYQVAEGEKLTAYGAILQSGGFSPFASESSVHVLRTSPDGTRVKLPANIKDVKRGRKPDIVLKPNDIVVVPEKWFSW